MSSIRGFIGVTGGVLIGLIAVRVQKIAAQEQRSLIGVIEDLPSVLKNDGLMVCEAAQLALRDGQRAITQSQKNFDEQVIKHSRRKEVNDDR